MHLLGSTDTGFIVLGRVLSGGEVQRQVSAGWTLSALLQMRRNLRAPRLIIGGVTWVELIGPVGQARLSLRRCRPWRSRCPGAVIDRVLPIELIDPVITDELMSVLQALSTPCHLHLLALSF